MKRHGLWQWHKALHKKKRDPIPWWRGHEEYAIAKKIINTNIAIFGEDLFQRPSAAVIRCANRYFRLKKIRPSIAHWNALTEVICDRMGANNMVLKSVQITGNANPKQCTKLHLCSEVHVPNPPYWRFDIKARLERITKKWMAIRRELDKAYKESSAPWSEIPSDKDWSYDYNHCPICGAYSGPITRHNYRGRGDAHPHTEIDNFNSYVIPRPYLRVCKNNKCRAVAHYSQFVRVAKRGNQLLIGLINECSKQKGNNPIFRGLAKHLTRHP